MRTVTLACTALLATLLTGCAGVDQRLTHLDYMPSKPAAKAEGVAVGVAMPTESHGLPTNPAGEVQVADVVTSGNNKRSNVVLVEPINKWVGNAVVAELRGTGVNAGLGLEDKPGRAIIKTEVEQIKNETKTQWSTSACTSTIRLSFKVDRDGKNLGNLEVTGNAKLEKSAEIKDVVHDAMERALRDALLKATPRLAELTR